MNPATHLDDRRTKMSTTAIEVDREGRTGQIQVSIVDGAGFGYRLAGPKYSGNSKNLAKAPIDEHSAGEIRKYLDRAFPREAEETADRKLLRETALQMERWAAESEAGGWSTHQVRPMRVKAARILAHLGREGA